MIALVAFCDSTEYHNLFEFFFISNCVIIFDYLVKLCSFSIQYALQIFIDYVFYRKIYSRNRSHLCVIKKKLLN